MLLMWRHIQVSRSENSPSFIRSAPVDAFNPSHLLEHYDRIMFIEANISHAERNEGSVQSTEVDELAMAAKAIVVLDRVLVSESAVLTRSWRYV